jgi:uncharacterized membrane protein YkvA (DUF1232 family)
LPKIKTIKEYTSDIKNNLKLYRSLLKDERTPMLSKILLWAAISYLAFPFDLIPDFIPVIGHLDDLIIVPGLVFVALKIIPGDLLLEKKIKLGI